MDGTDSIPAPGQRKRRYRGAIYIAVTLDPSGDDNAPVRTIDVCSDWLGACLAVADAPHGDIMFAEPGGNPCGGFRAYLEGAEPPHWLRHLPMARHRQKAVPAIVEFARNAISRRTARKALESHLADAAGFGGECFRVIGPAWSGGGAQDARF